MRNRYEINIHVLMDLVVGIFKSLRPIDISMNIETSEFKYISKFLGFFSYLSFTDSFQQVVPASVD